MCDIGAIISLLTFHSLEDRIAKCTLKQYSSSGHKNKYSENASDGAILELVNKKPIIASADEIKINPPSRSAKLRIARKLQ